MLTASGRTLGIVGISVSLLCWVSVFSRWSIFYLLPTVNARRETLVAIALLSIGCVIAGVAKHSKWWLLALPVPLLLFGLLRLH